MHAVESIKIIKNLKWAEYRRKKWRSFASEPRKSDASESGSSAEIKEVITRKTLSMTSNKSPLCSIGVWSRETVHYFNVLGKLHRYAKMSILPNFVLAGKIKKITETQVHINPWDMDARVVSANESGKNSNSDFTHLRLRCVSKFGWIQQFFMNQCVLFKSGNSVGTRTETWVTVRRNRKPLSEHSEVHVELNLSVNSRHYSTRIVHVALDVCDPCSLH